MARVSTYPNFPRILFFKLILMLSILAQVQGCTLLAEIFKEKARQNCEQNRDIEDYRRCRGQPGLPPPPDTKS